MRILLDVDGVLTMGVAEAACAFLRRDGVEATSDKITNWDIAKSFGLTDAQRGELWAHMARPGVARAFAPSPGARDFVAWASHWAEVWAVTSPLDGSPTWAHERERWLEAEVGISPARVVSARLKHVVVGDVLVDDKTSHLVDWALANPRGTPILWHAPYNVGDHWRGMVVNSFDTLRWALEKKVGS